MKPIAIRVSLLLTAALTCFGADPRLRIDPQQPHPGDTITVTYHAQGGPLAASDNLTLLYGFTGFEQQRTPLHATAGDFRAEIQAPDRAVYFWCFIEGKTPEQRDTDRGGAWDTYLFDSAGLPLEGARATRASLYERSHQTLSSRDAQLLLIEEELRAFPHNALARGQWWTLRFEDAGQTDAAREALLREVGTFFDSHPDDPWAYQAAALGYNHLHRNAQALDVLRQFLKRFPANTLCDSLILTLIGNYGSVADLESLPRIATRWSADASYWGFLTMAYVRSHANPEQIREAGLHQLALIPADRDTLGQARHQVAETWLANGVDPAAAEAVAREAVAISELGPRLEFTANASLDPRLRKNFDVEIHRSTLAWALYREGRYREALTELQRAVKIRESEQCFSRGVYFRLGQTLQQLGRKDEALDAYIKELAWGDMEQPARTAIAALGESVGSRVTDLLARTVNAASQPIEDLNRRPGRFELRGQDGNPHSLDTLRGKLVIVEFWATWCGPCLKSLRHSKQLMDKYPGRIAVLAVSIDDEAGRARAAAFLKDRGYPFTLLFDDENRRDLRVDFVPARFVIDPNGLLRAHESGWSAEQEVAFEARISALLAGRQ
jgi:thiol-disulfide isomerase/thioredoxin/tetratricopeptide (TPR) repeat protein